MYWWRIELDKSGAIKSCDQVDQAERGGRYVRFVEALDKPSAKELALDWHARKCASQRKYAAQRRERAVARGLCGSCGLREPMPGCKQCQTCTERKRAEDARRQARGGAPARQPVDPVALREKKQAVDRRYHQSLVPVLTVLKKLDTLGPEGLRAWLVERLAALPEAPQVAPLRLVANGRR